jgi:hypothetical protein
MNAIVALASPEDDEGIRGLLRRQTMPGRIRLAFCREPNFSIGCAVTGADHRILVARSAEHGEIVGVACRSIRHVFLNGRAQRIGYLGQLRVDERFRGRWLVSRGFSMLERMHREDPLPAYLASIVEENDEATGVLVSRPRSSFPAFREVAAYQTLALRTRRSKPGLPGDEQIVPASGEQLRDLVCFLRTEGARYQLFAVWTEDTLRQVDTLGLKLEDILIARNGNTIVGVAALWDQSAYKQAVVRGYGGWLKLVAPILPRIGRQIRSAYASLMCVANDDRALFARLLRALYNGAAARRFDYLLVGLDARDPLLRIARAYPHLSYPSRLYLGSWSKGGFAHVEPDDRLARVDIATL